MAQYDIEPARLPCPDYSLQGWQTTRNALIANVPDIQTDADAIAHLKLQWQTQNDADQAAYMARRELEQAEERARLREAEAALKQQEELQRQRDLEVAREREKKRTPLYDFEAGVGMGTPRTRIHPYAEKYIESREYFPLWYLTRETAIESKKHLLTTLATDRLELTVENKQTITVLDNHSTKASKNAVPDAQLTFTQLVIAGTVFVEHAQKLKVYPKKHIESFATFYHNLTTHPELLEEGGEQLIVHYHARVRMEYYQRNKTAEPFDPAVWSDQLFQQCRSDIQRTEHQHALAGTYQSTL
jgi:hypothetical protein